MVRNRMKGREGRESLQLKGYHLSTLPGRDLGEIWECWEDMSRDGLCPAAAAKCSDLLSLSPSSFLGPRKWMMNMFLCAKWVIWVQ